MYFCDDKISGTFFGFVYLLAAVGLAPYHYPLNAQPGWKANSVAYHADDGR